MRAIILLDRRTSFRSHKNPFDHPNNLLIFSSLTFAQRRRRNVVLVPEPVALLQDLELLAQEATERGSDDRSGERTFGETPRKKVYVLDMLEELGS